MRNDFADLTGLVDALNEKFPDQRWFTILTCFAPMGLATSRLIEDITTYLRDKVTRTLRQMEGISLNGYPLIMKHKHALITPGGSKRPTQIYILTEAGEQVLRHMGISAKACGLTDDIAILHAFSMALVSFLAADTQVITDKNVHYGDGKNIRPDHQVILSDQVCYLLEVEQEANSRNLPRIVESISNKQAFFRSAESTGYQKTVRMLVNLPPKDLTKFMKFWRAAMQQVVDKNGEKLGFGFAVMPLESFLGSPEWEEDLSKRWQTIDLEDNIDLSVSEQKNLMPAARRSKIQLERYTVRLKAHIQEFQTKIPVEERRPDWALPKLVRTIYEADHGADHYTYDELVAVPVTSIYALWKYIHDHVDLRARLRQVMHYNKTHVVWTQQNILHRMRLVTSTFLAYHGWRSSKVLHIYPTIAGEGKGDYTIRCEWGYVPNQFEGERLEIIQAFEWVLWALFEYAEDLELGKPAFL